MNRTRLSGSVTSHGVLSEHSSLSMRVVALPDTKSTCHRCPHRSPLSPQEIEYPGGTTIRAWVTTPSGSEPPSVIKTPSTASKSSRKVGGIGGATATGGRSLGSTTTVAVARSLYALASHTRELPDATVAQTVKKKNTRRQSNCPYVTKISSPRNVKLALYPGSPCAGASGRKSTCRGSLSTRFSTCVPK